MERFPLETASDLALNHAQYMAAHVWGDDPLFTVAVQTCGNCGNSAERLTYSPEYDVHACDVCMEDIAGALASESETGTIPAGVCPVRYEIVCAANTIDEMRAALRSHESECTRCGCTRKEVVSDRLMLGTPAVPCCGEVA